jgi:hypothetical protein
MLSKCANPECSESLHYFGKGKLFEVHFEDAHLCEKAGRVPFALAVKKQDKSVEHFWLCPECSVSMTVALDRQNNVLVLPRQKAAKSSAPMFRSAAAS